MSVEFNLEFVMWLTGHDRETILQMHNDWQKSPSTGSQLKSMTDSEKLRALADWFDVRDRGALNGDEVQQDLRRIADELDTRRFATSGKGVSTQSAVPSEELQQLVNEALTTDGAHHKQWYIEKISDKIGLLTTIEHDEGISP